MGPARYSRISHPELATASSDHEDPFTQLMVVRNGLTAPPVQV
jgi:hypothetical protein